MAYSTPTEAAVVSVKRMLVIGVPNSGKTASLLSWPRPLHYQCYPGEKGDATMPRGLPDVTLHLWGEPDPENRLPSGTVVAEVEQRTWEVLGGKHGDIRSFAGDGLHKYASYVLDWISGGALFRGEEIGAGGDTWASARIYNRAREHVRHYMQRVMASPVEYVVFTAWSGAEADEPGVKGTASHVYPDLFGKLAKEVMGDFGMVVYSTMDWSTRQPGKPAKAEWQLLPEGKVWGAAIKAPLEIMLRLPVRIPQGLPNLQSAISKAMEAPK
jgi:AAA domain-containing protein